MNAPDVIEQPTALPAVACSDLLYRAMNPKEGDSLEQHGNRVDVKAVGDGQVWYVVTIEGEARDRQMSLELWATTVRNTLKGDGAKYNAV